ncbi:MAG: hypothetical protein QXY64_02145 [Candidatus Bilamarchaeaceae archaeon]
MATMAFSNHVRKDGEKQLSLSNKLKPQLKRLKEKIEEIPSRLSNNFKKVLFFTFASAVLTFSCGKEEKNKGWPPSGYADLCVPPSGEIQKICDDENIKTVYLANVPEVFGKDMSAKNCEEVVFKGNINDSPYEESSRFCACRNWLERMNGDPTNCVYSLDKTCDKNFGASVAVGVPGSTTIKVRDTQDIFLYHDAYTVVICEAVGSKCEDKSASPNTPTMFTSCENILLKVKFVPAKGFEETSKK